MIKYPPQRGMFLLCDFSGFNAPEMTKKRPVIVVTPPLLHGDGSRLVTVVPLSTTDPSPVMPYHYRLNNIPPIPYYDSQSAWVKCDMLYTVAYDRLSLFFNGKAQSGKRNYIYETVNDYDFNQIIECIIKGLGFR